ncbi:hypothetical protein CEE69_26710 [Rhodopirellula bahusiensis]|uniref:Tetratricopeptide repeat protein n=1 Tax=Rhodopirellula bahusiensis TaxID=2014065 RepID=A0A2G1W040_9BACT|nr:hypothetical protein CEE69_26710 [Rhodopirellula bahusiensis]
MAIVLSFLVFLQGLGAYLAGLPGFVAGLLVYLILRFAPRRNRRIQRAALKLMAEERYADAAKVFEKGYRFFDEHRWYDRNRAFTMLDYSGMDYREMMLANWATNLALAGDKQKARELYRQCLELYPESRLAKPALRFLEPESSDDGSRRQV